MRRFTTTLVSVAALIGLSFSPVNASTQELELSGNFTQGGLVIGQLGDVKSVKLNDTKLKVNDKGYFVFGFGRDAKAEHTLTWVDGQGIEHQKLLQVSQREYKIDRIEGVASKYVSPPEETLTRIRNDNKKIAAARAITSDRLDFLSPVYKPAQGRISGVYGSQRVFNGTPKRPHFGLDIANATGTEIYAPLGGKVVLSEADMYYSGGTMIIDHGMGLTSTYIHMSALHVQQGDEVKVGQVIGEIGATGRVTGPHLDWRFNWGSTRLDPALLMKETLASEVNTNDNSVN